MYHCHPCFGGHKPVSPISITPPVIHPTKQCVTHTCSTTVVPHIHPTHTTHVHHQQLKNQHLFPQTTSNVNVVDSGQLGPVGGFGGGPVGGFGGGPVGGFGGGPVGGFGGGPVGGFGGGCVPCGHGPQISPYGPGPQVSPCGHGPQISPYGPGPNVSPFGPNVGPNVGGIFKK
ncbi:CotD family spore coat protein [Bacillus sp. DX1.1]|uniref:CotD family spore coat protein n=1 Tax=unclassified Bacillus (in: firmicutes) TaxID=185979 RepID=UPI0025702ADD|nr:MULTISPECIES: CotD family spore coat protein [unclassified Bacillus (in: firmicutes)]MDM5154179.1 CotD family spore coat protein [Bacillus sp. DX1.1]WJE83100.1 CotD family spore coat protein [Bacillus sp. DX3.1]